MSDSEDEDKKKKKVKKEKKEKKDKKKKKKKVKADGDSNDDASSDSVEAPTDFAEYSVEYFESILGSVRAKCEKKIKVKSEAKEKFLDNCGRFYDAWYQKWENEQWLQQLTDQNAPDAEMEEAQSYVDESVKILPKLKSKAIKAALKVFEKLDEEKMDSLEDELVKGAIIAQATPQKLAAFAAEGSGNESLIKRLFRDPELMRDMLRFGGASNYEYGNAMKIFTKCMDLMEDESDKKLVKLSRKIALACALELASTLREFDSTKEIDAVQRFQHFEKAHRDGELDPAFPNFSVWEMRHIVNCDAPNDQMKWCRDMIMNYVPHVTFITDHKLRYTFILESDVRIRKPTWTGSPRTYQMVLSGGGNQTVNSWFGRFLLKSFGLPTWGAKERKFEGYCRWTPDGWEPMNGAKWETSSWKGKTGEDFKIELESRNKAPQQEYWKKLVMLQVLADVVDGDPSAIPAEEMDALHPERFWRSLSIVSMALLFQTEPEVERTFEREGKHYVKTRNELYFEEYDLDKPDAEISVDEDSILIPASRHSYQSGNIMIVDSYGGGKQLNFLADGIVEYEIPDDATAGKYSMTLEVCTVSAKQNPLTLIVNDDDENKIMIRVPYTIGKWDITDVTRIKIKPGMRLKFSRPKNSLGVAIKRLVFK